MEVDVMGTGERDCQQRIAELESQLQEASKIVEVARINKLAYGSFISGDRDLDRFARAGATAAYEKLRSERDEVEAELSRVRIDCGESVSRGSS
jgi:hypothetical protein